MFHDLEIAESLFQARSLVWAKSRLSSLMASRKSSGARLVRPGSPLQWKVSTGLADPLVEIDALDLSHQSCRLPLRQVLGVYSAVGSVDPVIVAKKTQPDEAPCIASFCAAVGEHRWSQQYIVFGNAVKSLMHKDIEPAQADQIM